MGTVNIRNVSGQNFFATGAAAGYDVAGFGPGVTAINSTVSTSGVFLENVAGTTSVGVTGNGITTNGAFEAIYAATATAPVLNISGGTTGGNVAVAAAGATSFVINSTKGLVSSTDATGLNTIGTLAAPGAATSTMTINAASSLTTGTVATAVKQITVTGAAKVVTLGAITDANLTTIDASGMTAGGVTLALIDTVTAFTGGAGVDTVSTVATLGSTAVISGGQGTADILNVVNGDTTSFSTVALGGRFTNFEILRNSSAAAINVANTVGVTSLQIASNAGGFTNMTAAQAAAVTVRGTPTSATLSLAAPTGTTDVLNLNFNSGTATTAATLAALTADGFETINVTSTTGSAAAHASLNFTTGSATSLNALNISGAIPFDLTTTTTAVTKATAVNASGLTYSSTSATDYGFVFSGGLVKSSSITGSNTNDSITFTGAITGTSGQYVTINAGTGNDVIATSLAALNNNSAANASLKIEGGAGTDTVTTDAGTYIDNNFQFVTGVEAVTFATGALSLTTGGFFSTNFSGSGATITAAALGVTGGAAAAANVFDLATFAGNATIVATQAAAADANVGDSFVITSGSGNDVITLTTEATKGALTTTNTISTGLGNDTVTLSMRALGAGGTISVNLGAGTDTFVSGAAVATSATGGTGADAFTGGTGVNTYVQTMGDSVAATANTLATTIANGNTITFANGLDVITTFASTADKINTDIDSSGGGAAAIVNAVGQLASAVQTSNFYMRGDYLNGTFTISATGADTLMSLGKAASTLTFADATDYVLLVGVTSVANADFI